MFDLNRDIYGFIETTSSRFCPEPTMSILTSRSTDTGAASPWGQSAAGLVRWVAALPFGLMAAMMTTWYRRATIKALRELDDHTLRDIGLTRLDLEDALRDTSSLDLWLQL